MLNRSNIISQSLLHIVIMALLALSFSACKPPQQSILGNIYKLDESSNQNGNARRHQASNSEIIWTVEVNGLKNCSGTLLSPQHLITARHCLVRVGDSFRSGWAVLSQGAKDLKVTKILEVGTTLDYMILEVAWLRPMPSQQKFPPMVARRLEDILISAKAGEGDRLFSVGFPSDKQGVWLSTYAEGHAKQIIASGQQAGMLAVNIGLINGNSGGGILKKDNLMLTALVISGTLDYQDEGWDGNDIEDSENWNFAVPLWDIYRESKTLQTLYPDGRHSMANSAFIASTQLFVAVEEAARGASILVSASLETSKLMICPQPVTECKATTAGVQTLLPKGKKADRQIFRQASPSLNPKSHAYLIAAYDNMGTLLSKRSLQLQKKD